MRSLDDGKAWNEHTNQAGKLLPTYCQARAEVDAWVRRGGVASLLALLDALRDSYAFYELYGPMLTNPVSPG